MLYLTCGVAIWTRFILFLSLISTISTQNVPPKADSCETWEGTIREPKRITTQQEITDLLSCSIINRRIIINPASGEDWFDLSGIESFNENLTISNGPDLTTIKLPNLKLIDTFELVNLPKLQNLDISALQSAGSLRLQGLPSLLAVSSLSTIQVAEPGTGYDTSGGIRIISTGLQEIDFLETEGVVGDATVTNISITDNPALAKVDIKGMTMGNADVVITNNGGDQGTSIMLSDAKRLGNINITSAKTLFVPNLATVAGSLDIRESLAQTLDFPALSTIGGNFIVANNPQLSSLKYDHVTQIGNIPVNDPQSPNRSGMFIVGDNSKLQSIALRSNEVFQVGSGILLQGPFSSIETRNTLPFNQFSSLSIQSSDSALNCLELNKIAIKQWTSQMRDQKLPESTYSCSKVGRAGETVVAAVGDSPTERNTLSKEIAGVLVAVCLIGVVLGGSIIIRTGRHKRARNRAMAERVEAQQRDYEWIQLENGERIRRRRSGDHGVFRPSVDGGGDRPPVYERVGKPGEVPPQYLEIMDSRTTDDTRSGEGRGVGDGPITELQRPTGVATRNQATTEMHGSNDRQNEPVRTSEGQQQVAQAVASEQSHESPAPHTIDPSTVAVLRPPAERDTGPTERRSSAERQP